VLPAHAAFPGRNGRIAFVESNGSLVSVRPSGVGRHRLRREGAAPAYSPRGDRIVFTRFFRLEIDHPFISRFDLSRLELIGANGRGHSVLTGGDDYSPAWAPDGKRIVFARDNPCNRYYGAEAECPPRVQQDRKYGILVRRRDGSTRVVTHDGWSPSWSPNGKLISYVHTHASGGSDLYAIRPDGSGIRRLARITDLGSHDWSPDGRRIVFSSVTGSYIGVVRRDGTGLRELAGNGVAPAYSPDGRWIVFTRPDERHCGFAQSALLVMRASGGHPRVLRNRFGQRICGYGPDWQPLP
jgi:Tol biopolymer transport system component